MPDAQLSPSDLNTGLGNPSPINTGHVKRRRQDQPRVGQFVGGMMRGKLAFVCILLGVLSGLAGLWRADIQMSLGATHQLQVRGVVHNDSASLAGDLTAASDDHQVTLAKIIPDSNQPLLDDDVYVLGAEQGTHTPETFRHMVDIGRQDYLPLDLVNGSLPDTGTYFLAGSDDAVQAVADVFESHGFSAVLESQHGVDFWINLVLNALLQSWLIVAALCCAVARCGVLLRDRRALSAQVLLGHQRRRILARTLAPDCLAAATGLILAAGAISAVLATGLLRHPLWCLTVPLAAGLLSVMIYLACCVAWVHILTRNNPLSGLAGALPSSPLSVSTFALRVATVCLLVYGVLGCFAATEMRAAAHTASNAWRAAPQLTTVTLQGVDDRDRLLDLGRSLQQLDNSGDLLHITYAETAEWEVLEHVPNVPMVDVNRTYVDIFPLYSTAGQINSQDNPAHVRVLVPDNCPITLDQLRPVIARAVASRAETNGVPAPEIEYLSYPAGQRVFVADKTFSSRRSEAVVLDPIVTIAPRPVTPFMGPLQWSFSLSRGAASFLDPTGPATQQILRQHQELIGPSYRPFDDFAMEMRWAALARWEFVGQVIAAAATLVGAAVVSAWVFALSASKELFVRRMHGASWRELLRKHLAGELFLLAGMVVALVAFSTRSIVGQSFFRYEVAGLGIAMAAALAACAVAASWHAGRSAVEHTKNRNL